MTSFRVCVFNINNKICILFSQQKRKRSVNLEATGAIYKINNKSRDHVLVHILHLNDKILKLMSFAMPSILPDTLIAVGDIFANKKQHN